VIRDGRELKWITHFPDPWLHLNAWICFRRDFAGVEGKRRHCPEIDPALKINVKMIIMPAGPAGSRFQQRGIGTGCRFGNHTREQTGAHEKTVDR
jgi:hypothetical protein